MTGGFISGSSATSILVIVYSTDNRNDIYYVISPLSTEGETLVTNISGLATGLYNVPVFVLEENGLPFIRSASTPRSMLVGDNRGGENGEQLIIPYSRKIWRGIKFGGLAVYYYNRQIKIRQNFLLAYIRMAILYRTAKFKSANILSIAILGSTAKFNARQYFRLYGSWSGGGGGIGG